MPDGEDNDDDRPFPSPFSRSWVHPAEASARLTPAPAPPSRGSKRVSAGMLVASASVGALAMFGALAATGMVSGFDSGDEGGAVVQTLATTRTAQDAPARTSMVSVRADGDTVHRAAGLVIDDAGHIVTSAAGLSADSPITVDAGGQAWTQATLVGIDPATDLAVIRVGHPDSLTPVTIAEPAMGQVRLVDAVRGRPETKAQLANTNESVSMGDVTVTGVVVLSTDGPPHDGVVVVDSSDAVVALPSAVDDDHGDRLLFAVPAQTALHVAHDLIQLGRVTQVSLGMDVADDPHHDAVVVSAMPEGGAAHAAGIRPDDRLSSIDRCPTPDSTHLWGCLMRYRDRSVVSLTLYRDEQRITVDLALRDADAA